MNSAYRAWWVGILLICACTPQPRTSFRSGAPPQHNLRPCPVAQVDTTGWQRHSSRLLPFTVLLPADFRRDSPTSHGGSMGEGWTGREGARLSYVYIRPEAGFPDWTGGEEGGIPCALEADGSIAELRSFAALDGTAGGEFLAVATWRGSKGERLVMRIVSDDEAALQELFATFRSVRFLK